MRASRATNWTAGAVAVMSAVVRSTAKVVLVSPKRSTIISTWRLVSLTRNWVEANCRPVTLH